MVKVCPLCKRVLNQGEECGCLSSGENRGRGEKASRAAQVILGAGSSTTFLLLTLFFTMSVFFSALSFGSSSLGVYGVFLGRPGGAEAMADGSLAAQTVIHLLFLLPSILICAGFWVLFLSARNKTGRPDGVLSYIKGAVFAQFAVVLAYIAFLEGALFTSFSFVNLQPFEWGREITNGLTDTGLWFLFLANAAAGAVMVVYFLCALRAADTAVKSLRAGKRWGDIPTFLILANLALAFLNLAAAAIDVWAGNAAAAVSAICAAAFLFAMSASLNLVKKGF